MSGYCMWLEAAARQVHWNGDQTQGVRAVALKKSDLYTSFWKGGGIATDCSEALISSSIKVSYAYSHDPL